MTSKLIIWDWNGTLLNDVNACVDAMNVMLQRRNMNLLDHTKYKRIFTFPVQDYYNSLGFNFQKESFEELSIEYIDLYKKISKDSPLQIGVKESLSYFKENDCSQIIISASEQVSLEKQVDERGITQYFDSIIGLNNIHAKSKLDNATNYINDSLVKFDEIIFIGDTYHDFEVAKAIGADCILVQNGHQVFEQFKLENNATVINDLGVLLDAMNSKIANIKV